MTSKITPDLLNDTLNLVQLARETALARGNHEQAARLAPVASGLQTLAASSRQTRPLTPPAGILGQSDFQALLKAVQAAPGNAAAGPGSFAVHGSVAVHPSPAERSQIVSAMASAGMPDTDIARHMGITRDEVRLIMNMGAGRERRPGVDIQR